MIPTLAAELINPRMAQFTKRCRVCLGLEAERHRGAALKSRPTIDTNNAPPWIDGGLSMYGEGGASPVVAVLSSGVHRLAVALGQG